ncbi:hypothetical protein CcCBS67573_g05115 [Chytriomyces confervae]|uniref:Double-strand break repair protein n=1 Tax=Chytriomyces confervae TaxID=246404 RepID=A0A507FE90_9FUNG|nr:hypothetical protein CcCBS67573_g05115 [Chytriomyces confervae]
MLGMDEQNIESRFKILIATDNHLGYLEKDPVRGNDSFAAFAEILALAQEEKVDFILLGGDLFHDNKPSRKCMHKTMTMLRQFCMGDKPCLFDFVSAQDETFKDAFATVNYCDPNYNVSIPIFSIHGNHDDPSGDGDLCALDLLSAAGLVNYFGRADAVDDVQISPMLLKKSDVKLAVYGMGNIRDERLFRTFTSKKVRMFRPKEDKDDWFNVFVLHQNRVKRGPTNYIPESFLPDFLHLVVWGHEHDCLIDLEQNEEKGFFITQPGSSVATSLSEGEMIPKHVGILEIHPDKQFKLEKVALKTVRPFVMDDIVLADCNLLRRSDEKNVDEVLADKARVEEMITTARNIWKGAHPDVDEDDFPRPLIRLRVDYSNFSTLNPQRFGQRFVDRVANPKDILYFFRKRQATPGDKKAGASKVGFDMPTTIPERLDKIQVEDLVDEFLAAQSLEILPENGIGEAVRLFVEKEDKDAISDFYADSLKRTQASLNKAAPEIIFDESNLMKQISKEKLEASAEISLERARVFETGKSKRRVATNDDSDDEPVRESGPLFSDNDDDDPPPVKTAPKKAAARGSKATAAKAAPAPKKRAAPAAASKAPGKRRKKAADTEDEDDEDAQVVNSDKDEDDFVLESPAPAPPKTTRSSASSSRPSSSSTSRSKATASNLKQSTLNFGASSASSSSAPPVAKPKSSAASVSTPARASAKKPAAKRATVFEGDSDEDEDEGTTFANFGKKAGGGR